MRPPILCVLLAALASVRADTASPNTDLSPREQAIVAASKDVPPAPVFHGPGAVGVWPGTPFLYKIAVTGDQPMTFAAQGLHAGLSLDAKTGLITGQLDAPGEECITLTATNAAGQARADLCLFAGNQVALTPPLAWNSYDAYGDSVTEAEMLANAAWMQAHLQGLGWDTIILDFRWYDPLADGRAGQANAGVLIDEQGFFQPAPNRFPSSANGAGLRPLADRLHALGFKFGLHLMRGIPRKTVEANLPIPGSPFRAADAVRPVGDPNRECSWNKDCYGVLGDTPAGRAWYAAEAKRCAEWGVDYIKCDDLGSTLHPPFYLADEVEALAAGLRAAGRSVVLSTSPGETSLQSAGHVRRFANAWRITNDFWDDWKPLDHHFDRFEAWSPDVAPGTWPDGDMLPLGHVLIRNCDKPGQDRWTHYTRPEQLTLVSLWSLASSPLLYGGAAVDTDPWTLALLANPEVLAVNQDPQGRPARRMYGPQVPAEIWTKGLTGGGEAVGLFNRGDQPAHAVVRWRDLGYLTPPRTVRDLWVRRDVETAESYTVDLPPHGCVLLKVVGK